MQRLMVGVCIGFLLAACAPAPTPRPLAQPGYVLAGQNVAGGFASNALTIFDPATLAIQRKVALPHSWAQNFSRAPNGNVWIGFSGNMQETDNRVQIYSPQGDLIKTLQPCVGPEAGISFAANRAFIACAGNGLAGQVAVVGLDTLQIEKTIPVELDTPPLLLVSSAANDKAVLVIGLTSGPQEGPYSVATLIDPHTLVIQAQLALGANTDVWRSLPYGDKFYLLNVASYRNQPGSDILILEPGPPPTFTTQALAASPLWGAIDNNVLYAYHNPTWNSTITEPRRQLSRLDLASGQTQVWALPDGWNASDLAFINGQVILVKWEYWSGDSNDGLFRFDAKSGQLIQIMTVPDASGIALPR